jgi:hypothetical protein
MQNNTNKQFDPYKGELIEAALVGGLIVQMFVCLVVIYQGL